MSTRRTILKSALATGTVVAFSGTIGGLRALADPGVPVRRSLLGMADDDPDLTTYREFVRILLAADQSRPVSWLGYSLLHGQYKGPYRYCPHGDWYFLPWHRGYVAMYEQAARELTGNQKFAMPYWDWTRQRELPSAFTLPTYKGRPNPLYVANRTLTGANWPLRDDIVGPDVMNAIYMETDFQRFGTSKNPHQYDLNMGWVVAGGGVQGTLEANPHNNIHNFIGGFMPTAGSPRDPIFMMHHSNIDRIWAHWNALGRDNTAGMSPTDRDLWLKMVFADNFLRPDGAPYSARVGDLQNTIALGYTYDNLPSADGRLADPQRSRRLAAAFAFGTSASDQNFGALADANRDAATPTKPLEKAVRLSPTQRDRLVSETATATEGSEVFALLRDIDHSPGVEGLRVFVSTGESASDATDGESLQVTQVGFLEHGKHSDHKGAPSILVELTPALRGLSAKGISVGDTITVKIAPVLRAGVSPDGQKAVPASVEIIVL
ncbi:MAG: tyrosinase family protein [Xanthomonadaceae bacterium]|nr:tyrosinase family protein [Xanthomonadaceae bacterium]